MMVQSLDGAVRSCGAPTWNAAFAIAAGQAQKMTAHDPQRPASMRGEATSPLPTSCRPSLHWVWRAYAGGSRPRSSPDGREA